MNEKKNRNNKIINSIKVISFILVFVAVLEIFSMTVFSKSNATTYKNKFKNAYNYVNEVENSIDIIALGNSNMYSAICPVKLWDKKGYTSTVIASPRQSVAMTYTMLYDALEKQSPKMVILEQDMFYEGVEFNPEAVEEQAKSQTNKRLPTVPYITDDQLTTDIQNHFTIFLLHDSWKQMIKNAKNIGNDATFNHGYYFNKTVKKNAPNSNMDYTDTVEAMPEDAELYLNKILDLCRENNIELMFIGTPSLTNWSYARHNAVEAFADKNNISYLDFNTLEDYEINYKRDYRDKGNHMNYYGAKKITNYIGNFIKNNYPDLIEDKRKNDDFAYWYDDKARFIEYHKIKKF